MKTKRWFGRTVPAIVAAALLAASAGCSAQAAPEVDLPEQNRAGWVMPLDQYASPAASSLAGYASVLLAQKCMAESGVDIPVAAQPTDEAAYLPEPANPSRFPMLTPEIAQRWGYRAPSEPGLAQGEDREAFIIVARSTPGFDALYDSCLDEGEERISPRAREWSNHLNALINQARDTAEQDAAVVDADRKWKTCLSEKGYASLPGSPLASGDWMPTRDLETQLGIERYISRGLDGSIETELTAVEIELALADAECRESTGWSQARYQAEWNAQAALVAQDADALVRGAQEVRDDLKLVLGVIAENAPAQ